MAANVNAEALIHLFELLTPADKRKILLMMTFVLQQEDALREQIISAYKKHDWKRVGLLLDIILAGVSPDDSEVTP